MKHTLIKLGLVVLLGSALLGLFFVVGLRPPYSAPTSANLGIKVIGLRTDSSMAGPDSFTLPPSSHTRILAALDGSRVKLNPAKWVGAGTLEIQNVVMTTPSPEWTRVEIDLFQSKGEICAFRVEGTYYRCHERGLLKFLDSLRPKSR